MPASLPHVTVGIGAAYERLISAKVLLSHGIELHDLTMMNRIWLIFARDLPPLTTLLT